MNMQAYKMGLYGPRVVWMTLGWIEDQWWKLKPNQTNVDCTQYQLDAVAESQITTGLFYRNPDADARGLSGRCIR